MSQLNVSQKQVPDEVKKLLLEFTIRCLADEPANLYEFGVEHFKNLRKERGPLPLHTGSELTIKLDQTDLEVQAMRLKKRRTSVCSETFNPEEESKDGGTPPELYPKTAADRDRLSDGLKNVILFKSLDPDQIHQVIDAMFEKIVLEGDIIIKEGEDGDYFYVIQKGVYQVFKSGDSDVEKLIHTYEDSGSFGELALMYNVPRAATIKAASDGALWVMDRKHFRRIVLKSAFERRKMYEELMECVPLLQLLEPYERMALADALETRNFADGELIIHQGDTGDGMYFVESGLVSIRVVQDDVSVEIKLVSKGGYFGEVALISQTDKRAASAYAVGYVKTAFLDAGAFERLLGPCIDIMKRNLDDYKAKLTKIYGFHPTTPKPERRLSLTSRKKK